VFGINGGEALVLVVLAAILIGPKRLPEYAKTFARVARQIGKLVGTAKTRVEQELGEAMPDISTLDPRQYDPRRIIRDALTDITDLGGDAAAKKKP
jgi:sec-independent protein translocase protein TatB